MRKRIKVRNGGLIPYPHSFLAGIFKSRIVSFTFCTQGIAVFLFYTILVITPAITLHGKTGFTGWKTGGKKFGVF